jgi:hypothetical protein
MVLIVLSAYKYFQAAVHPVVGMPEAQWADGTLRRYSCDS